MAAGHCAAIERGEPGAQYMLGGENVPQRRVFEIVSSLTGRGVPARIPFPVARLLGVAEECRVNVFGGTPLITRGTVEILRHDWSLDSGAAARDLGYTITPLEEGIRRIGAGRAPSSRHPSSAVSDSADAL